MKPEAESVQDCLHFCGVDWPLSHILNYVTKTFLFRNVENKSKIILGIVADFLVGSRAGTAGRDSSYAL